MPLMLELCLLLFTHSANATKKSAWIAGHGNPDEIPLSYGTSGPNILGYRDEMDLDHARFEIYGIPWAITRTNCVKNPCIDVKNQDSDESVKLVNGPLEDKNANNEESSVYETASEGSLEPFTEDSKSPDDENMKIPTGPADDEDSSVYETASEGSIGSITEDSQSPDDEGPQSSEQPFQDARHPSDGASSGGEDSSNSGASLNYQQSSDENLVDEQKSKKESSIYYKKPWLRIRDPPISAFRPFRASQYFSFRQVAM